MLLWLPVESSRSPSSSDSGPLLAAAGHHRSNNNGGGGGGGGGGSASADKDEKSYKLRLRDRQNRARRCYKNSALACLSVAMVLAVTLWEVKYPAVNQGQLRRAQRAAAERAARLLPPSSIYRLSVPGADGASPVSLAQFAGKVSLVVNTACL
jgi:hypothetical protein